MEKYNKSFTLILDKIPFGVLRVLAAIIWLLCRVVVFTVVFVAESISGWVLALLEINITEILKTAYYWDKIKENS